MMNDIGLSPPTVIEPFTPAGRCSSRFERARANSDAPALSATPSNSCPIVPIFATALMMPTIAETGSA